MLDAQHAVDGAQLAFTQHLVGVQITSEGHFSQVMRVFRFLARELARFMPEMS